MEMNKTKVRILVTGANGFVGSHVLKQLLEENRFDIGITIRKTSNLWRIDDLLNSNISTFSLDETEISEIISNFKPDVVVHLAVYYKKNHTPEDIDRMIETNILFPTKVLDAMINNGVKYFVNTGTFTEYLQLQKELTTESEILPRNLYSATKVAFEDILKYYAKIYDLKAVTLKLTSPYGPKDFEKKLIPYLINCAISGEKAKATLGVQIWDYVYVKDIARAYSAAILYLLRSSAGYDSFIIGSGESYSLRYISEVIEKLGYKLDVEWGAIKYSDAETYFVKGDIIRARNILKWWPVYSLEMGLRETIDYYLGVNKDDLK